MVLASELQWRMCSRHFGFAKSLPFLDIQGILIYFVVDVFLTLRRFQLVELLCAVAVMPWLLVFIV